jgi:hypothetical protein
MMFVYNEIETPDDCIYRISPSQIAKFFNYPSVFYKENILGEKEDFLNTAMALGTVCHYVYECVGLNKYVDTEYIEEEINKLSKYPDVDINEIKSLYRPMCEAIVNEYLLKNMPDKVEYPVYAEVKDGVYVGGRVDVISGSMIVDWKHVATKPNTMSIPFHYKIQLLAYAYAMNRNNYFIDRIRLVYCVKPTKTLPVRVITVTEEIGHKDWELINETLELMADTILLAKKQPELVYLLFKSMKLKEV